MNLADTFDLPDNLRENFTSSDSFHALNTFAQPILKSNPELLALLQSGMLNDPQTAFIVSKKDDTFRERLETMRDCKLLRLTNISKSNVNFISINDNSVTLNKGHSITIPSSELTDEEWSKLKKQAHNSDFIIEDVTHMYDKTTTPEKSDFNKFEVVLGDED